MKFCPYCGKELRDNAKFCASCGGNLELKKGNSNTNNGNVNNNINSNMNNNVGVQSKSKIAAGLLGILLGAFGVHNFYLGYTGKAVGQLLLTLLSCGALSFVSGIWGLIEGIMILTGSINVDANGNPLSE